MRLLAFALCAALVPATCIAVVPSTAPADAVLSTSGASNPLPNNSAVRIRAASNETLTFSTGTKTCGTNLATPRYASLADGTITNSTITGTSTAGTFTTVGTIAGGKLIDGDLMPSTQTSSSACPTSISGIPSCTNSVPSALTIAAQIQSNGSSADTGVNVRVGSTGAPVVVNTSCVASGGGTVNCSYTSGTSSTTQSGITGFAAYSGSPAKASTLVFTNQSFYKSAGPAGCPATSASVPAKLNVAYQLFCTCGAQISAYQSSSKP